MLRWLADKSVSAGAGGGKLVVSSASDSGASISCESVDCITPISCSGRFPEELGGGEEFVGGEAFEPSLLPFVLSILRRVYNEGGGGAKGINECRLNWYRARKDSSGCWLLARSYAVFPL